MRNEKGLIVITSYSIHYTKLYELEPLLQNTSNNGGTWKEYGVKYQTVYYKKKVIKDGSATLWNYAENLIEESVKKGILEK